MLPRDVVGKVATEPDWDTWVMAAVDDGGGNADRRERGAHVDCQGRAQQVDCVLRRRRVPLEASTQLRIVLGSSAKYRRAQPVPRSPLSRRPVRSRSDGTACQLSPPLRHPSPAQRRRADEETTVPGRIRSARGTARRVVDAPSQVVTGSCSGQSVLTMAAAGSMLAISATPSPAYIAIASTLPDAVRPGGIPEPLDTSTVVEPKVAVPTTGSAASCIESMQARSTRARGFVAQSGQSANSPVISVSPTSASRIAAL